MAVPAPPQQGTREGIAVVLDCGYYLRRRCAVSADRLRDVWVRDLGLVEARLGSRVRHVTVVDWKPADAVLAMIQGWASSDSAATPDDRSRRVVAEVQRRKWNSQFHASLHALHSADGIRVCLSKARVPSVSQAVRSAAAAAAAAKPSKPSASAKRRRPPAQISRTVVDAAVRQLSVDNTAATAAVEYCLGQVRTLRGDAVTPQHVVVVSAADSDMSPLHALAGRLPGGAVLHSAGVAEPSGLRWGLDEAAEPSILLPAEEGEGEGEGEEAAGVPRATDSCPVSALPAYLVDTEVADVPDFFAKVQRGNIALYQQSLRNEAKAAVAQVLRGTLQLPDL